MVAAVAVPVLKTMLTTALTKLPQVVQALETTSKGATAKSRGFNDIGVTGAADTTASAGPLTAKAGDAIQQLGTGFRKIQSDLEKVGAGADAQQAKAIIENAFGSAEHLNGLVAQATAQTSSANGAMEAGTGSGAHQKSKTGGNYEQVLNVLRPVLEAVNSILTSGKATGQEVGARASS